MELTAGFVLRASALATVVGATNGAVEALRVLESSGAWPRDALDWASVAAAGLTLSIGLFVLLRLVATGLRGGRSAGHELALARLLRESRTDSLTRLENRRAFNDDLALAIERRNLTGSAFSLMAIDLDGLKEINDTRGHQAGDAHLRWVADALQQAVGTHGTVYRTGGDEFMVLLPGIRNWHAIEVAHRIHEATTEDGIRAVSIGVTESRGTERRQELVREADVALYSAKRRRLPVVPFQPALEALAEHVPTRDGREPEPAADAFESLSSARTYLDRLAAAGAPDEHDVGSSPAAQRAGAPDA